MIFEIDGKIKPYVRMTRRGKYVDDQAQEYLASQYAMVEQFKQQMSEQGYKKLPDQTPLFVTIRIGMPGALHRSDLDNQCKAITDAMQAAGVFRNDCWIDREEHRRVISYEYKTFVTVVTIE